MDETSDEDEAPPAGPAHPSGQSGNNLGLGGATSAIGLSALGLDQPRTPDNDTQNMSVSTLHLYDLHLSQVT